LLHTICTVIQIISALVLVVLMAVQTEKAQQGGGVMGLGGAGGRSTGTIDMAVGAERILKPLTKWTCGAFFTFSILAAVQKANLTFVHVIAAIVLYILAMLFGSTIWSAVTGMRNTQ
jgi:protein translocase SecG subunit